MKKTSDIDPADQYPDLDWSKGVRGKYSNLLPKDSNVVILDPALLPYFPNSEAVNSALHALLKLNQQIHGLPARPSRKRGAAA